MQTHAYNYGKKQIQLSQTKEPKRGISSITALKRSEVHLTAIVCGQKSKNQEEKSKDKWANVNEDVATGRIRCCINEPDRSSIWYARPNPTASHFKSIVHSREMIIWLTFLLWHTDGYLHEREFYFMRITLIRKVVLIPNKNILAKLSEYILCLLSGYIWNKLLFLCTSL